ncbi:SHOCT domain-containing protein [Halovenus rubra]|uniref:SHOCT domain-containing protein n=2 Tax=Halovenus rubra TaxID=869890 RepID=A0ACC7DZN7_9EURY|nr:SHOCT domain-containing protein [Halovenus rubra]
MSEQARQFVADELWLAIAVVTLPLLMLSGMVAEPLSDAILVVGWFLLTPVFLFWGDEIAALLFSAEDTTADEAESATDAVEELKRRYARGEIDEAEFERRLDRLVALDEGAEISNDAYSPPSKVRETSLDRSDPDSAETAQTERE